MFDEARLVHDEHPALVAQFGQDVLAQVVPHGISRPGIAITYPLDAAGMGIARLFGQLPAILALDLRDQAVEIIHRMALGLAPAEVPAEHQLGRGLDDLSAVSRHVQFMHTPASSRLHDPTLLAQQASKNRARGTGI